MMPPASWSSTASGSEPVDGFSLELRRALVLSYQQGQIDRLRQRLARREAELAVSQEWGYADCEVLTEQIKSLRENLERLNYVAPSKD
jgi:hypothetical protein